MRCNFEILIWVVELGGGLGKHASNRQFDNSQPPPRSLTTASKDGAAAPGQLKCTEQ